MQAGGLLSGPAGTKIEWVGVNNRQAVSKSKRNGAKSEREN